MALRRRSFVSQSRGFPARVANCDDFFCIHKYVLFFGCFCWRIYLLKDLFIYIFFSLFSSLVCISFMYYLFVCVYIYFDVNFFHLIFPIIPFFGKVGGLGIYFLLSFGYSFCYVESYKLVYFTSVIRFTSCCYSFIINIIIIVIFIIIIIIQIIVVFILFSFLN